MSERWMRSAAVGVALLIAVGACAPSELSGPTASASPRGTASPSSVPAWVPSSDQASLADVSLRGVTFIGPRFLAVTSNLPEMGLLLESTDGQVWERLPTLETDAWTIGPDLLATGPGGVIAVGGGNGGPIAIWSSVGGRSWSRVPDQDAFQMRDGVFEQIHAVIPADGGWLAVGGGLYNDTTTALVRAFVLTSPDSLHWKREPDQAALAHAVMNGIVWTPAGYVAVGAVMGSTATGVAELHAAMWTSPDGLAWSLSAAPPATDLPPGSGRTDVILDAIAVLGDRMVVAGSVDRYDAAGSSPNQSTATAWWSDGTTWTPVQIGPFDNAESLSITAMPSGFLVLGASIGSRCAGGAWSSRDGTSWRCITNDPVFDGFAITGFAASPDIEVLVGMSNTLATEGVAGTWALARR